MEGCEINRSLFALNRVLQAASRVGRASSNSGIKSGEAGSPAALYRGSALTRLLQPVLSGAKIFLLGCVHPGAQHAAVTARTLRYVKEAKDIKTNSEESALLLERQGRGRERGVEKLSSHKQ